MEVAVLLASISHLKRQIFGGSCCAFFLGGILIAVGGCADIVTFAGESREQGIKLYNEGNYPEAAGAFTSAIKQRPQDYQSYYYLGRTSEAIKNYHQAVSQYRTALSVMSNSLAGEDDAEFRVKVLEGLAGALAAGNDASLEQAAFAKTNGPSTAEDHFVLAKARWLQHDPDSSLEEYQKAAKIDPKSFVVAKEYGLTLLRLNQRTKAANELRRAYVLNHRARLPDDPQVNDSLRKAGVIPGPSLGEEGDLAQPLVPQGPLPEIDLSKTSNQASTTGQ
jgi:tetratricopeptide (TPR) repeat protein